MLITLGLVACTSGGRPPQTGFYCLDLPADGITRVPHFIDDIAKHLDFEVSAQTFDFGVNKSELGPRGKDRFYEVHGKGVSLFVMTSMVSGPPDAFGNRPTEFNQLRYSVHAAKTGLWQRIEFNDVIDAAAQTARSHGLTLTKADEDACAI